MGCDLHAVVYAKTYGDSSEPEPVMTFSEPRWYGLFGAMAGVRSDVPPVAEPRGLPAYARLEGDGDSIYLNGDVWIGDHSYSWLTVDEFAEALKRCTGDPVNRDVQYEAALAFMRVLQGAGQEPTIVFGFDN